MSELVFKTCSICGIKKSENEYYKRNGKWLHYCCKLCNIEKSRINKIINKEHHRILSLKYNRSIKYRFGLLKRNKKGTDITREDYDILIRMPCYYCKGALNETGIGLDRLDSNIGYFKKNIVPCCLVCNRMKNNLLLNEFFNHIKLILKTLESPKLRQESFER